MIKYEKDTQPYVKPQCRAVLSMTYFNPRLEILPPSQRALWDELYATPEYFTLYGGTALALHLGHRDSVDFAFFSRTPFKADDLMRSIPYLEGAESHYGKLYANNWDEPKNLKSLFKSK